MPICFTIFSDFPADDWSYSSGNAHNGYQCGSIMGTSPIGKGVLEDSYLHQDPVALYLSLFVNIKAQYNYIKITFIMEIRC